MQGAMAQSVASRGLVSAVAALIGGKTVDRAAGDTAITMGATRPFANPYYWSGFILTGL
jgi:CHAT domain-containing protein